MAYDTGGLRAGGDQAATAGTHAQQAADTLLQAVELPSSAVGEVVGAAELARAVQAARTAHARTGQEAHTYLEGLRTRSHSTAALGDGLILGTAAIARTGTPGAISTAMAPPQ